MFLPTLRDVMEHPHTNNTQISNINAFPAELIVPQGHTNTQLIFMFLPQSVCPSGRWWSTRGSRRARGTGSCWLLSTAPRQLQQTLQQRSHKKFRAKNGCAWARAIVFALALMWKYCMYMRMHTCCEKNVYMSRTHNLISRWRKERVYIYICMYIFMSVGVCMSKTHKIYL